MFIPKGRSILLLDRCNVHSMYGQKQSKYNVSIPKAQPFTPFVLTTRGFRDTISEVQLTHETGSQTFLRSAVFELQAGFHGSAPNNLYTWCTYTLKYKPLKSTFSPGLL